MKPQKTGPEFLPEDPAFAPLIVDMLSNVLSRADNPSRLGSYLVEELRELTGARCVLILQCIVLENCVDHQIVSINPERRRSWALSAKARRLYEIMHEMPAASILRSGDSSEASQILLSENLDLSLAIPLMAGEHRVGAMLVLGLPDSTHIHSELKLLASVGPIVALVLRNSFLYERQEQIIRERTADLERANEDLRDNERRIRSLLEESEKSKESLVSLLESEKKTEEALRESEARFRAVIEQAGDGFKLADSDGILLDVNSATCRLLGYSRGELLQLSIPDINQITPERFRALFQSLIGNKPLTFESVHRRKDGSLLRVEITASVIQVGGALRYLSLARDITERLKVQEEQQRVQAQLAQAQKMELVGKLAGGVAHDFNNMLSVILGNIELVMPQVGHREAVHSNLQEIQKAAERSSELTRQLLAFARKQRIEPRVLDLNDAIAGSLNMLRRLIGENIDLAWMPGANLWPLKMDLSQVNQLLTNLCVNARDAIAGTGRIEIKTENCVIDADNGTGDPDLLPGDYVLFSVKDTGCGMTREVMEHLFEPFFTTKSVGEGTGLGLAMIYGIVKQNKGLIRVNSELQTGTTFKIYLPTHKEAETSARKEPAEKPSARGQETILLVEDEPALLKMTTRMLEQNGYTVLPAASPWDAIRLSMEQGRRIHLLVTDIIMPEMNGRELARKLRSAHPQLKCLFMSGYTADVIDRQGSLDPKTYFLQKPFSMRELTTALRQAIDSE